MIIRTLLNIDTKTIMNAFNSAFSDYVIKLQLTEESLLNKITCENITLDSSVGAYEGDILIAFVLNGLREVNGKKTVYNAGTGVIPEHRGKRIIESLYHYFLPVLEDQGYTHHQLEVIQGNEKAIRIYKKPGFEISRTFSCFRGKVDRLNK